MYARCLRLNLCTSVIALFNLASFASAQSTAEDTLEAYLSFANGGTWMSTIDGEEFEHSYTWKAGKKFGQLNGRGGVLPFVAMIGVDPETKQCTWWVFNDDGSLGKNIVTMERDGVWLLRGGGKGSKGETRYEGRLTRVDDDTLIEETVKFIANGEEQASGKWTWKRKR